MSSVKYNNNPIRNEQQQSFDPMHYPWFNPWGSGMKSDPSGVIKGDITFFQQFHKQTASQRQVEIKKLSAENNFSGLVKQRRAILQITAEDFHTLVNVKHDCIY